MKKTEFRINGEYIELIGLLKVTGIAVSGADAKQIVDEGLVMVNGNTENRKRAKLRQGDKVTIQDLEINLI